MGPKNETWYHEYVRGKMFLSRHDPEDALKRFEVALALCPVEKTKELARIMFYLGVALNRLGMSSCALKSWSAAHRLDRQSNSGKFLLRFANSYGMARQETQELDDWKAFYSVQLARYLSMKKSKKLGTEAEKDMIWELILEAWREIRNSMDLSTMTTEGKLKLFRAYEIVFPVLTIPENGDYQTIAVDFAKQRRVGLDDQCFCGSGLPYKLCCGRTPGEDELATGVI